MDKKKLIELILRAKTGSVDDMGNFFPNKEVQHNGKLKFDAGGFLCPICGKKLMSTDNSIGVPYFYCPSTYHPSEEYSIWRAFYGYEVNENTNEQDRQQIIDEICDDGLGHEFLHWMDMRLKAVYDKRPDHFFAACPNTSADIKYLKNKFENESFPSKCTNDKIRDFFNMGEKDLLTPQQIKIINNKINNFKNELINVDKSGFSKEEREEMKRSLQHHISSFQKKLGKSPPSRPRFP